jgi:hypothetical protein
MDIHVGRQFAQVIYIYIYIYIDYSHPVQEFELVTGFKKIPKKVYCHISVLLINWRDRETIG